MASIHAAKEKHGLQALLERIEGREVTFSRGSRPVFAEPVPQPNRQTLLDFYRSMVAEGLVVGRIYLVLGEMYRTSIWLGHKPFHDVRYIYVINDFVFSFDVMKY